MHMHISPKHPIDDLPAHVNACSTRVHRMHRVHPASLSARLQASTASLVRRADPHQAPAGLLIARRSGPPVGPRKASFASSPCARTSQRRSEAQAPSACVHAGVRVRVRECVQTLPSTASARSHGTSVEKMQTQIYFGITLPEKSASSWIRSEFGRPYL